MKSLIASGLSLAALLGFGSAASAEPLQFRLVGAIASECGPGLPMENTLNGLIVYDPDSIQSQIGTDYFPDVGSATISISTGGGFELSLASAVISVQPGAVTDRMFNQSFLSESANDWHIAMVLSSAGGSDGWLRGEEALPDHYPTQFQEAYLSAYKTDEYEWADFVEATICSIERLSPPPPIVPPSPAGKTNSIPAIGNGSLALLSGLLLMFGFNSLRKP